MVTQFPTRWAVSGKRSQAVFKALADPTRRAILDGLRVSAGMSVEEIAERFPMSRPAVSKHLGVLRRASLVRAHKRGRERVYRLEPTPLRVVDDWLAAYRVHLGALLVRLKEHVEKTHSQRNQP